MPGLIYFDDVTDLNLVPRLGCFRLLRCGERNFPRNEKCFRCSGLRQSNAPLASWQGFQVALT